MSYNINSVTFSEQNTYKTVLDNLGNKNASVKSCFVSIDERPYEYRKNKNFHTADVRIFLFKEVIEVHKSKSHYSQILNDFDIVLSTQVRIFNNAEFKNHLKKCAHIPCFINWCYPLAPNTCINSFLSAKQKNISFMPGAKNFLLGHKIRHYLFKKVMSGPQKDIHEIELFPPSVWVEKKESIFDEYRYSIIIENVYTDGLITEKIIDCFLRGTIPIYWGDPKIVEKYFNTEAVIFFSDETEFFISLKKATEDFYNKNVDNIKKNMQLANEYIDRGKYELNPLYNHILQNVILKL